MASPNNAQHGERGLPRMLPPQPKGHLLRWRREQLIAIGYDEFTAYRLAADAGVDIHAIVTRSEASPAPVDPATRDLRIEVH